MTHHQELANAIRFLSIDAVEQAQSGHPGMPMGMADIATILWRDFLKHSPANPKWFNRDRFVLSNGHGSMLLYALLHLSGYQLSLNELKQFRQLHSKTPGHPEYGETPGVDTTTGPLGQGLANAVGMAIAEKGMAALYNRDQLNIVDHYTYVFLGDGCLMEGISHEACSLAGVLQLGKLIAFYDDNHISIDGHTDAWFQDDSAKRFTAYGWHVIEGVDGHDPAAIHAAIKAARAETKRPSLIMCKTIIGFGSSVANSEKAHGAPLGAEAIAKARITLEWPYAPFDIPDHIYAKWNHVEKGSFEEQAWLSLCQQYQSEAPEQYHSFLRRIQGDLPDDWHTLVAHLFKKCSSQSKPMATRKASQFCIEELAQQIPELLGGSADLTGSNNTDWSQTKALSAQDFTGNYIHYGVREFGMAAIMNGIALHGGYIPYGGTFLVFSDYARNAIRLSALMQQRVIYILTHDSIGLGEDGPTHQPIEHASILRMTPNLNVWRPADLTETACAWQHAIASHHTPSCLLLSRQNLPALPHTSETLSNMLRGGYVLLDTDGNADAILIATGSEVQLALAVAQQMAGHLNIRVVSMPCADLFLNQDTAYQESVLPKAIRRRIAIEAASPDYWYRFVGLDGKVIGIERFGVSAKAEDAYKYLGITTQHIIDALKSMDELI